MHELEIEHLMYDKIPYQFVSTEILMIHYLMIQIKRINKFGGQSCKLGVSSVYSFEFCVNKRTHL